MDTATRLARANETPDSALGAAVMARIAELIRYRAWWRANRWADWPQVRWELDTELRALLRLRRESRRRPLPVETDLDFDDRGNHYLFPEGVIEGLPEFNGSFR